MSAIVVGTYIVALYGAFGTSVSAKTIIPGKLSPRAMATTRPAMVERATLTDVSNEAR